jgi:hypothetical protein
MDIRPEREGRVNSWSTGKESQENLVRSLYETQGSLMRLSINTATPFLLRFAAPQRPPFFGTQGQYSSSPTQRAQWVFVRDPGSIGARE